MRICVTGGCGFIGHHFVEHVLKNTDWEIVILDKLGMASHGFDRLRDIEAYNDERVSVLTHDISAELTVGLVKEIGHIDYFVHMAAESHVDRSITHPEPFVISNVVGTMRMLELARTLDGLKKFVYFSTDEVFGPAPAGKYYKEWDRFKPSNPYAAAKAGGECLVDAWVNTYGLPAFTTHTMNVFGERQDAEKYIPLCIRKILKGEKITIHADKTRTQSGSRCWIHARNVAAAVMFLLDNGLPGERYNIVGEEYSNVEIAGMIAGFIGKNWNYDLVDFHSSRPGHDLRYALDGTALKEMGFDYPKDHIASLRKTVEWTLERPQWLGLEKS
jgi:dTDP-glucose 4,6-dehydratase